LELAAGIALGSEPDAAWVETPAYSTGRSALEAFMAAHLVSDPCVVSFSGGRDSSAVLALATHVARREGLPLPVPVTFRFPDSPMTYETDWQEHVIAHLGLEHWERMDLTDELDLLGDIAKTCLRAVGPTSPANVYLHVPVFRVARGGTVLTGLDGDGLFGDWKWCHAQQVLHGRVRPHPKDLVRVAFAMAPPSVRGATFRRRMNYVPVWLSESGQRAFVDAMVGRAATEPRQWDRRLRWHAQNRALHLAVQSLDLVAALHDVRVAHPLLEPQFLAALAHEGGAAGLGDRTSAMRHLAGDLLPVETVERRGKAVFNEAVWREGARTFAAEWDGTGLDPELVDPDRLREVWLAEYPVFHSWSLLQLAWLSGQEK
jgi:asparagine synthase (glutamine-hydrolysing)